MSDPQPSCRICSGTGRIRQAQGFFTVEKPCPACRSDAESRQQSEDNRVSRSGYVYILFMTAGVLKIGHTRRHPEDRADEWGLQLLAYARAEDSADAEKRLHEYLSRYRKGSYELFEVSFREAIRALETIVGRPTILHEP
jgi:hypothetical protein